MKKREKKLAILLIILGVMFCCVLAALIVTRMTLNDEVAANQAALGEMSANKKTVYVVSTADGSGIGHGEVIEEGVNVVKQTVYTGLEDFNYITEDDLGSMAVVDIYEGMTVMENMVSPISIESDTREYEMQVVNLMTDQQENDVVDIRIMFPDGSDFLVLPKKQIKNLNLPNCVFYTYLNEEEILRMASATIDAYTITGTKIYATRYVESNLQEEAVPTYLVNAAVADQMDPGCSYYDKNLLTKAETTLNYIARHNLEENLSILSKDRLAAVAEGHNLEDTAKTSVLTGVNGYDMEKSVEDVDESTYDAISNDGADEDADEAGGSGEEDEETEDDDAEANDTDQTEDAADPDQNAGAKKK